MVRQRWKLYCKPKDLTVKVIFCTNTKRYYNIISEIFCPSNIEGESEAKQKLMDFTRAKDWYELEKSQESVAYMKDILAFIENSCLNKNNQQDLLLKSTSKWYTGEMDINNHEIICAKLKEKGKDPLEVLKLNGLDDFSTCILGKNDSIRNAKGHMLKGLSGNPVGRSKEVVQEEKESNIRIKSRVQEVKEEVVQHYAEVISLEPVLQLAVALLGECRTKYDLDSWLKTYLQFFVGKKQSLENTQGEKKEITVQIGSVKTTEMFKNVHDRLVKENIDE